MSTTAPPRAVPVDRARVCVSLAFAANGLVFATWVSRIPAVKADLGLSPGRLGLVLLAMAVGAVLALPSSGTVIARIGAAWTVRLASVLTCLGLALAGLAPDVPVLVVGLFLMGLGSGNWDVAMNVEGAEVERRLARSIMPRFHAGFSAGTVVGALVGAGLVAVDVPTSVHLAGVAVVVAVVVLLICRDFLPAVPHPEGEPQPQRRNPLLAWREPRTLVVGLMVLAFAFAEGSANDWLAVAVVEGYGVSHATGVLVFAVFVTAMTVGRMVGTVLLDRHGRVAVLRATAVLAVTGLMLVVLGGSVPLAALGAVLWGIGASLGFPVGMSAGADDPAHSAARVSVVSSIGYTAFLAGPPLIGFLADRIGVLSALWVVVAVLATGLVTARAAREPARA